MSNESTSPISTNNEPPTTSPIFLGWNRPWLHQLVDYLIKEHQQHKILSAFEREVDHSLKIESLDLSNTVVILSGSRAGRRLLELLAIEAAEKSLLLIPPRIVTLREAVPLLLAIDKKIPPEAGSLTSHLAWRKAMEELPSTTLAKIQKFPESLGHEEKKTSLHRLASIAEKMAYELGSAELDFRNAADCIGQLRPDFADREEARWQALAQLQERYRALLASWNLIGANDALRERIAHGTPKSSLRVVACAVADFAPLFVSFLKKINPTILIAAPEAHAAGFSEQGQLVPAYWHQHPASIEDEQIISCERSDDQAEAITQLCSERFEKSNASNYELPTTNCFVEKQSLSELIAIAAPDHEAVPVLQETMAAANIKTRSAGGRSFRGGRFFHLLQAVARFIHRPLRQAPSMKAVATLLRQPDISTHFSNAEQLIKQLDLFEREHLPQFLEQERIALLKKNEDLLTLLPQLERLINLSSMPEPLSKVVGRLRHFLFRVIGKKTILRANPDEYYFLGCLEKWMNLMEEVEQLAQQATINLDAAEFISLLLSLLSSEEIPGREEPDAIELLGWLELAADDIPIAIISSFYEGAIPRSSAEDPLLSEGLRRALKLTNKNDLLARDHYLLHTIVEARRHSGNITIIAPRYNGRGEPVRPSRLLLLGCVEENLPRRILSLTQRQQSVVRKNQRDRNHLSSFEKRMVGNEMMDRFPVTSLRTYLKSPRLFYLKHILKLQEIKPAQVEMDAQHVGTLIHQALAAFGSEKQIANETDSKKMNHWLQNKLKELAQWQFGEYPQFPIWSQIDEIARTLSGFAMAQAVRREEGWKIVMAENSSQKTTPLEEEFILNDGRSLFLHGRIDRIDWHPGRERWAIIDYKTSSRRDWQTHTPNKDHFKQRGTETIWHDLQLPLYLKLAHHLEIIKNSGLPQPTIKNTDLCYFQLPCDPERAAVSESFDCGMIEPAWEEAHRVIKKIADHHFEEIGNIDIGESPTFAALCGITRI